MSKYSVNYLVLTTDDGDSRYVYSADAAVEVVRQIERAANAVRNADRRINEIIDGDYPLG